MLVLLSAGHLVQQELCSFILLSLAFKREHMTPKHGPTGYSFWQDCSSNIQSLVDRNGIFRVESSTLAGFEMAGELDIRDCFTKIELELCQMHTPSDKVALQV